MSLADYSKPELAIFLIGILAIVLTFIIHFTHWGDTNVETSSTVPLPLGSKEFLTAVESISGSAMKPLTPGSIKILSNGEEFAPDLIGEISRAERSVTLANYIFKEGIFSEGVADALIERAKAGVQVRILLDGKGGINRPDDKMEELKKAGGKVATFRPLNPLKLTRINKRTHVRAIVIDGKVGYTGGLAFEDGWLGDGTEGKGYWRDLMFKLEDGGARDIQNTFNSLWRQTDGEILSGESFYPDLPTHSEARGICETSCYASFLHAPSPDLEKDLSQLLWISIMSSEKSIRMETPYLLPDKNVLKALKQKAKSGVSVEVIVPGPYVDTKIVQAASRSYYGELLGAGIKIYEYQPSGFHSKIMVIDGAWSVVGSANLDNRSNTLNVENILAVKDVPLAQGLEKEFELDKSRAKLITLEEYQSNFMTRALGRISRIFAKQY